MSEDLFLLIKGCGSGNFVSSSLSSPFKNNDVHLGRSKLDVSNVMSITRAVLSMFV